jgi:flagellar basal body-associated protein FliL
MSLLELAEPACRAPREEMQMEGTSEKRHKNSIWILLLELCCLLIFSGFGAALLQCNTKLARQWAGGAYLGV